MQLEEYYRRLPVASSVCVHHFSPEKKTPLECSNFPLHNIRRELFRRLHLRDWKFVGCFAKSSWINVLHQIRFKASGQQRYMIVMLIIFFILVSLILQISCQRRRCSDFLIGRKRYLKLRLEHFKSKGISLSSEIILVFRGESSSGSGNNRNGARNISIHLLSGY